VSTSAIKAGEQVYEAMSLEVFFRESKTCGEQCRTIGNPKAAPQTKMAGAFDNRFRARGGWGCGIGAAGR